MNHLETNFYFVILTQHWNKNMEYLDFSHRVLLFIFYFILLLNNSSAPKADCIEGNDVKVTRAFNLYENVSFSSFFFYINVSYNLRFYLISINDHQCHKLWIKREKKNETNGLTIRLFILLIVLSKLTKCLLFNLFENRWTDHLITISRWNIISN